MTGWELKRNKSKNIPNCRILTENFGSLQDARGPDTPCLLRLLPLEVWPGFGKGSEKK